MVGSQFHPEFLSRPNAPHPLFSGFVAAALNYRQAGRPGSHLDNVNGYAPEVPVSESELRKSS